ncbi:CBO0543 family protein [Oceanobacillus picturae]|uniref:CBO0543 family protein n=1 Tax=Oceanobacillus picturae TaxID=171693 RepID=UPI003636EC7C
MIFLIISIVLYTLVAVIVPKRLTKSEMYQTSLFALVFVLIVDFVLSWKLGLYGYFNDKAYLRSLLVVVGIFPAASVIYLNLYPFKKEWLKQLRYILIWSIFVTVYEWLSIKYGYFYHNGWSIWYSAIVYPFVFATLTWNLVFFRKLTAKGE